MGWVYTLELEGGRYYIGYTEDLCCRIGQHFLRRGSLFTRTYKPLRVVSVVEGTKELEDAQTIALMAQHSYKVVRGGRWTSLELRTIPLPLAKALSIRPQPMPEAKDPTSYDYMGQVVDISEDSKGHKARVSGPLACTSSSSGLKCFRASSSNEAKQMAETWIDKQLEVLA